MQEHNADAFENLGVNWETVPYLYFSEQAAVYDDAWFASHDLILLTATEYQTDNRQTVVGITSDAQNNWTIWIRRFIPMVSGQTLPGFCHFIPVNKAVESARSLQIGTDVEYETPEPVTEPPVDDVQ